MKSTQRAYSGDPKLLHRVKELIASKEDLDDPDEIAYQLQAKYPEYARKKRGPFEAAVVAQLASLGIAAGSERTTLVPLSRKRKKERTSEANAEITLSSDDVEMAEYDNKSNNSSNRSVTSLYTRNQEQQSDRISATPRAVSNNDREEGSRPSADSSAIQQRKKKRAAASAVRGLGAVPVGGGFETKTSTTTFADIGGYDRQKLEMCRMSMHVVRPRTFRLLGVEPPRGCLIHGPPGSGKTLFAQAIAGEFRVPLLQLAVTELVSGVSGETEQKIRALFQTAKAASPCVLVLDDIDAIAPRKENAVREMERRVVSQISACMDELFSTPSTSSSSTSRQMDVTGDGIVDNPDEDSVSPAPPAVLVIGTTSRIESVDGGLRRAGRFDSEIAIGIPDQAARFEILKAICKLPLDESTSLAQVAHLTPGYVGADLCALIREAAKCAVNRIFDNLIKRDPTSIHRRLTREQEKEELDRVLSWLRSEDDPASLAAQGGLLVTIDDFQAALENVQPSAKREGFATVPDVSWEEIGALKRVRDELEWSILCPIRCPGDFAALGMSPKANGILLCGPPGCGKTLVAKAIANESGLNFISVKGPELLNMYVGESERAVRTVFQRARDSSPCVIFFDEIDALCARRSSSEASSGGARIVNQLLTEMDGVEGRKQVFIIGATNRPDIVDAAILRPGRLDKILFVDLPNAEDRLDILRKSTKNGTSPKLAPDVDLLAFAADERLDGFTGADLVAMIHQAAILALKERRASGSTVCVDAVKQKHLESALLETRPSVTPEERKRYAAMKTRFELQIQT